jgi:hypothetical protein
MTGDVARPRLATSVAGPNHADDERRLSTRAWRSIQEGGQPDGTREHQGGGGKENHPSPFVQPSSHG